MHRAKGSFTVRLEPQKDAAGPARMTIDKQFEGDLEATSQGQMLSAMGTVKGSAGYVAIETVTGKLQGRAGSFVLLHSGTMKRGVPQLSVSVVPDSGTGELAGIEGTMQIENNAGQHTYVFDYSVAT